LERSPSTSPIINEKLRGSSPDIPPSSKNSESGVLGGAVGEAKSLEDVEEEGEGEIDRLRGMGLKNEKLFVV